ncbi:GNAT family N-acetyltransferase [Roseiconus sp. JC912]|uniref:GNAT family N-acetyltransferase n=1 Tax=Roseiconus sp. JC912 TaxID=3396307 RepID=UPI003A4C5110
MSISTTETSVLQPWIEESAFVGSGAEARLVPLNQLHEDQFDCWRKLRATSSHYRPPFFAPEFAQAVQRVRRDVDVIVVFEQSEPIAFLPIHRQDAHAYPVGRFFNDAHNIIQGPATAIPWHWLLNQVGLRSYRFHALVGQQLDSLPRYSCHCSVRSFSCQIGDDPMSYLRQLGKEHKTVGRQGQKTRKLNREVGEVEFEFDCRDLDLLRQAIQWKRNQYNRTHILDLFATGWTRKLVEELFHIPRNANGLRGVLSTLKAGGKMVAAHFGIREGDLLHYWFPVYDPAFAKYSPGTGLFVSILQSAQQLGLRCIDMGYGEQPYKRKQTDATGVVGQGCISPAMPYRLMCRTQNQLTSMVKSLPMKSQLKKAWRTVYPNAGQSKLD